MKTLTLLLAAAVLVCSAGCHALSHQHHHHAHDISRGHHGFDPPQARAEIEQMMHGAAQAWTDNDLEAFMACYAKTDDLRFAIPSGVVMGWDTLHERYSRSINNSDLRFSDLDIQVLSPDAAFVFGRFHNTTPDGGYGTGLYTLLVRKIDGKWVIVHDHSSDLPEDYEG